jgi:hypothetical protein
VAKIGRVTMRDRLTCLVAGHQWRRSRFVALNARVANLVCDRCHKQKEG